MQKKFIFTLGALIYFTAFSALTCFAAEKNLDPVRWEKAISDFEASDKTNPPPKNAVLIIGSSSARLWKSAPQDFPEHKIINRGFGGSQISDSVHFFDRIVKPYKPKQILFYAGSNDINAGKTPEQVFADFTNFVAKAHQALPKTRVAFISIGPNPARWNNVEKFKKTNQLIQDFAKKDSKLDFIDVFPAMLGDDGKPKSDIFLKDNLHMNEKGYAIWTPIVRPYLKK
jgi:lysophospholipase L1-like esterase